MATKAAKKEQNGTQADAAEVDSGEFQQIHLRRLEKVTSIVEIEGLTPLIPHKWSEKAKRMMLDKMQGKANPKKEPKDPEKEAFDSAYWLDDGRMGIPATAFKGAIADAARFFDKTITIEMLKRAIWIQGEGAENLVAIEGPYEVFEATPRNSGGTADLRYRYRLWPWHTVLEITYVKSMLTAEALIALVDAAGLNGVGDWRPSSPKSKTGTFGAFRVKES